MTIEGVEPSSAIPEEKTIQAGELTKSTMLALAKRFRQFDHKPSAAQLGALYHLAVTLEEMANGVADPLYYLCSLDPGVGKTQTIAQFVKALLVSQKHEHVGVIVFVSRRREITSFLRALELEENDCAVVVSDKDEEGKKLNAMGNPLPGKARILFTTQQMLETRTKQGRSCFEEISAFHFHGKPRLVRIWDEECLPARPVTISVNMIEHLADVAAKARVQALEEMLNELIVRIRQLKTSSFVEIPDLQSQTGLDANVLDEVYKEEKQEFREGIFDLWLLSGKTVKVVQHGQSKTCVHYDDILPDDLKPLVIADASGRVRQTYHHWREGRRDLVTLTKADKDYSNLTIHLWERTGSKTAWTEDSAELVDGIVSVIRSKSDDERWLIVQPQPFRFFDKKDPQWSAVDVLALLRPKVARPERLSPIYWGGNDFRATNEYRDIRNVVLSGTHFLPEAAYHALARLSLKLPSDQPVPTEVLRQIKNGEHANYVLQAVCRGAARQSIGNACGQCDVYVIAGTASGIPTMLRDNSIFPGAKIIEWQPVELSIKPTGNVARSLRHLEVEFSRSDTLIVPAPSVMKEIGISDGSNWNKDVVQHEAFQAGIKRLGIEYISQKGRGGSYFERAPQCTTETGDF